MVAAEAVPLGLFGALVLQVHVAVVAARAPVAVAALALAAGGALGLQRLFGRAPEAVALEPLHDRFRLRALQLDERGLQVRRFSCPKRGGALADQNGPVGSRRCHASDRIRHLPIL